MASAGGSVAAAQAAASGELKGTSGYRLGAGDKVKITVYNEDMLSGQYEISGSGIMSLPLIGEVPVAGRSVPEVIAYLTKTLKDGGYMLNPSVSMEVMNYRPFYVLGEIKDPGKYAYVSDMNVLNAVALAGGYTYRAKKDKALIIRASDPEKKEQVAKPGDQVMPGDIIRIPERFF
ncbi:polysaccharide export protein [Sphingomonas crocodyli]|uniref:Polysaccharide export protein n=2 Tax=Sphingomonas crocodyli TaxID=1979270 RepID=A0A437LWZ9_9SPHN|nr:polysaccharide export protein [Sphingomonas crocodyli]